MPKAGNDGKASPVYLNSGVRSGRLHDMASGKPIRAGELVVFDLIPVYPGYRENLCRASVIGTATDQHDEFYVAGISRKMT
jgi:Xaa-Pro dipeptidase